MVLIFLANTIERAVLIIVITLHKSNIGKFTVLKFGAVTMGQKHHRTIK